MSVDGILALAHCVLLLNQVFVSMLHGLGRLMHLLALFALLAVLCAGTSSSAQTAAAAQPALRLDIPHSNNPLRAYRATVVPTVAGRPRLAAWTERALVLVDGMSWLR